MSDIYDLYKPIRNCARRCNVSASLIDIWQIANHIHNGTPAPGVPPQDLRSYIHPWDLPIMAREILLNGSEAGVRRLNTPQEIARLVDPIKAAERACIKHRIPRVLTLAVD